MRSNQKCYSESTVVYSGTNYEFFDEKLQPYTTYHYKLLVYNGAGMSEGTEVVAITDEDIPSGLDPPQLSKVKERTDQLFKLLPGINVPNNIDLVLMEPGQAEPLPVD